MNRAKILLAALPFIAPAPALAQAAAQEEELLDVSGDSATVSLGVAVNPDYEGSNEYRLIPGGSVRAQVSGHAIFTRGLKLYVDAIPESDGNIDFSLGPVAGLRLNRTGEVDDPRVGALGELDTAYELGGFAGIGTSGLTNPYDSLAFNVTYLTDAGNAHGSYVITPSIEFGTPLSRKAYVGLSLSADFVGEGFADYYFSVSPAGSAASGLSSYDADGGFKSWSVSLLTAHALTGDLLGGLSIGALVSYSRLQGDFARSPLVSQAGSPDQIFATIGLGYTF